MKKILSLVLVSILLLTSVILCGCDTRPAAYKKILAKDETDGQFYYFYDKDYLKGYAIVGDMEENNPEVMYLPAYYKGKEVKRIYYPVVPSAFGMSYKTFGPSFQNVKKLYVPFALTKHYAMNIDYIKIFIVDEIYYAESSFNFDGDDFCYLLFYEINHLQQNQIYYFTPTFYSEFVFVAKRNHSDPNFNTWDEYCDRTVLYYHNSAIETTITFYKANTSFCFNYENSPNDGVFFVDNSDYGTTIKDTPYYPLREGYGFTGWYKEPECINKWDFENNTLPTVEYDEEGNPTEYIETKLYAGWQKV